MDECRFYRHGIGIRAWYPPEDLDPMVMQEPNKNGICVFGDVNIRNGKLITKITDRYNALTFLEFLSMVHARFPDSVLVLDNAMYHHAGIITDYAFLTGIDLLFLPSYSPKLNPIERVWKLVKKNATHNRYFQLLSDLGGALVGEFSKYSKPNRELTKLCVIT